MAFHPPANCRYMHPKLPEGDDNNGMFMVPYGPKVMQALLRVIASNGEGWEHVSVSLEDRLPTWPEMCHIKGLFWDDEDCVVQFHPPKSEYVNCHPNCLHLWRKIGSEFETPPAWMVGPK